MSESSIITSFFRFFVINSIGFCKFPVLSILQF